MMDQSKIQPNLKYVIDVDVTKVLAMSKHLGKIWPEAEILKEKFWNLENLLER